MAQINAQQFINVVVQLLQRTLDSRNIADQKLTVQQPRPIPVLKLKQGTECSKKIGTRRSIGFEAVFFEIVFFTGHACSLSLGYHSHGRTGVWESEKYFVRRKAAREVKVSYEGLQNMENI